MSTEHAIPEALLTPFGDRFTARRPTDTVVSETFENLVRTHQRQIYRILWLQLRDRDAAETLTQECFLRAFRKWHDFRGESSVGTWLIRIALNLARDHSRNRRLAFWRHLGRARPTDVSQNVESVLPDPDPSPERRLIAREQLAAVWASVNRLPARQRTCFVLRYVEELPIAEIARVLQLEVGTVKAHLARAVGAVRRHVTE